VFGARLAEAILSGSSGPRTTGVLRSVLLGDVEPVDGSRVAPWADTRADGLGGALDYAGDVAKSRDQLQRVMIEGAGVVRDAETLSRAGMAVDAMAAALGGAIPKDRAEGELANLVTAAGALLRSAVVRRETRGAHARSDYPVASEQWRRRIIHRAEVVEVPIEAPPVDPGLDPSADVGPHQG